MHLSSSSSSSSFFFLSSFSLVYYFFQIFSLFFLPKPWLLVGGGLALIFVLFIWSCLHNFPKLHYSLVLFYCFYQSSHLSITSCLVLSIILNSTCNGIQGELGWLSTKLVWSRLVWSTIVGYALTI